MALRFPGRGEGGLGPASWSDAPAVGAEQGPRVPKVFGRVARVRHVGERERIVPDGRRAQERHVLIAEVVGPDNGAARQRHSDQSEIGLREERPMLGRRDQPHGNVVLQPGLLRDGSRHRCGRTHQQPDAAGRAQHNAQHPEHDARAVE